MKAMNILVIIIILYMIYVAYVGYVRRKPIKIDDSIVINTKRTITKYIDIKVSDQSVRDELDNLYGLQEAYNGQIQCLENDKSRKILEIDKLQLDLEYKEMQHNNLVDHMNNMPGNYDVNEFIMKQDINKIREEIEVILQKISDTTAKVFTIDEKICKLSAKSSKISVDTNKLLVNYIKNSNL